MRAITVDADTGKRIYTRKEVADLVGASTQSIRLWEDAGAIPASVRDEGGYSKSSRYQRRAGYECTE